MTDQGPRYSRSTGTLAAATARRRTRQIGAIFVVLVGVLLVRLFFVQIVDGSSYAADARAEMTARVTLPATRGTIYDSAGNVIEVAAPRYEVIADDFLVTSIAKASAELAPLLGVRQPALAAELGRRSGYVVLAPRVDLRVKDEIAALGLGAITFQETSLVVTPAGSLVQPILGGVDASGVGYSGVEYMYNKLLAGQPGSQIEQVAANGLPLASPPTTLERPRAGEGLVLSIDEPLQLMATRAVAAEMRSQHADSGTAIIEDVRTGAILAMVDLCTVGSTAPGCFRVAGPKGTIVPAPTNLAATVVFEPGSVMKIATFSYAIQDGLISPTSAFSVPDSLQIGGYTFQDAEVHPTVEMPACQILAQSSNIGTIEISRLLGPTRLGDALAALGFGASTGLHWPGASPGLLAPSSTWTGGDLGSIPIGTGEGVTAQQILDAYNTIANGGVFVSPRLVDATVTAGGTEHPLLPPAGRRVLTARTDATLVRLFSLVTRDGTAVAGQIPGYPVAGKTGTAQVVNPHGTGYIPGDWNATFVGFTPTQAPRLSGIVTLHRPDGYYGGSVSAPVFHQIMTYALHHYDIAPPSTPAPQFPPSSDPLANECHAPQLASHTAA